MVLLVHGQKTIRACAEMKELVDSTPDEDRLTMTGIASGNQRAWN